MTDVPFPTAKDIALATPLVALYDFAPSGEGTDEIPLTAGCVVSGIEQRGEWWWGVNGHRVGLFPANYVGPVEVAEESGAAEGGGGGVDNTGSDSDGDPESDDGGPPAAGGGAAVNEDGPDPFVDEEDDEDVQLSVEKREAKVQRQTIQTINGLNLQWVYADNLHFGLPLLMHNGNFSGFVQVKLLLTDNFLVEAAYFTADLPEITAYPLYKLYCDSTLKQLGLFRRGYITMRSQYYFCNLSTTANGGGHNIKARRTAWWWWWWSWW